MIIDLTVGIPDSFRQMAVRELQILFDGVVVRTLNIPDALSQTMDTPDIGPIQFINLQVPDSATITIELRGIYKTGGMSAPLVHEFTIVDGMPQPPSDIFDITILRTA